MAFLKRLIRALPLLLLSPFLMTVSFLALFLVQLFTRRSASLPAPRQAGNTAATIVIPNWNGKDLLAKYLPSIRTALAGNPANQILVVDNGSTDGSADFLRATFPEITVLALPQNLGFGGGSNAGFRAAKNDIVVLLNSDMRVAPDFLGPLLEGFRDAEVFAVSCQIFFSDPHKVREETGLTQAWWQDGGLRVRHRIDHAFALELDPDAVGLRSRKEDVELHIGAAVGDEWVLMDGVDQIITDGQKVRPCANIWLEALRW